MTVATQNQPPNNMPIYRLLTGPDDASFCQKVSDALTLGYKLFGSPAVTHNGQNVIVAQAVIWPSGTENYESKHQKNRS